MKNARIYFLATLLSLPFIKMLHYLLNPPQCPADYTQAQVDASRCIIGANIGGMPLLIISAPIIWAGSFFLVKYLLKTKSTKE